MLKNFKVYLERVQKQENSIIKKINEIIEFKKNEKIKDYSETFTFFHYPEGQDFNPVVYSNIESPTAIYIDTIEKLLEKISSNDDILNGNNSLSYTIDYNKDGAQIKQSFSKEKEQIKREDQYLSSSSESEVFSYKK